MIMTKKKARFAEKQNTVTSFTCDGKTTVQICLNETEEQVQLKEGDAYTEYVYDFNEFTDVSENVDVDAIKADPSAYLDYQPAAELTAEERLSELEQAVQDLAMVIMGE